MDSSILLLSAHLVVVWGRCWTPWIELTSPERLRASAVALSAWASPSTNKSSFQLSHKHGFEIVTKASFSILREAARSVKKAERGRKETEKGKRPYTACRLDNLERKEMIWGIFLNTTGIVGSRTLFPLLIPDLDSSILNRSSQSSWTSRSILMIQSKSIFW